MFCSRTIKKKGQHIHRRTFVWSKNKEDVKYRADALDSGQFRVHEYLFVTGRVLLCPPTPSILNGLTNKQAFTAKTEQKRSSEEGAQTFWPRHPVNVMTLRGSMDSCHGSKRKTAGSNSTDVTHVSLMRNNLNNINVQECIKP